MEPLHNVCYDDISLGQRASYSKTLTERDIALFAACSGDVNPVHLDAEYAAGTEFGERIGHGMWVGALISAALGTVLPGPGSVYRSQELKLRGPVRPGDTVTVELEVTDKKDRQRLVTLACTASNQEGKKIATGTAVVIAPAESLRIERPTLPAITVAGD